MRLLVTGGTGWVGRHVVRVARAAGHDVVAASRNPGGDGPGGDGDGDGPGGVRLDVRDATEVRRCLETVRPDAVVHTAYDQQDWATTTLGTVHVVRACSRVGARLVALSSDLVLPSREAWSDESVPPAPTTPYAAAKAACEAAVSAALDDAVVVRTSLVVGSGSKHHALVHAVAAGQGALREDEIRCTVHVLDLSTALVELAARADAAPGLLHVAGPQALSRHEPGDVVARHEGLDPASLPAEPRGEAPGPACVRPDSTLATSLLRTRIRTVDEALAAEGSG
ncbi:sugar nucleotide-binding protein [Arsenicicoccus sp. UBA7492]|uniref:sugar nucleotide-binding protein n=1 Tax=Arsenicicoccus sp. UBA7492 TaxID=1946057 RepID=UPI002580224F|nr:sugar nucleotide-binding protein [Arsenicicoccus sp. UBA7492]